MCHYQMRNASELARDSHHKEIHTCERILILQWGSKTDESQVLSLADKTSKASEVLAQGGASMRLSLVCQSL